MNRILSKILFIFTIIVIYVPAAEACTVEGNTIASDTPPPVCDGTVINLSGPEVTVTGGALTGYQWQASNDDGATWIDIATGKDYTPPALTANVRFRRVALTDCGTDNISNEIVVGVFPDPTASPNTISGDSVVCRLGPLPEYSGTAVTGVDYNWQRAGSASGPWTDVGTAQDHVATDTIRGTEYFRRIVSNGCGSTTSNVLEVKSIPAFGSNNSISIDSKLICKGDSFRITGSSLPAFDDFNHIWEFATDSAAMDWSVADTDPINILGLDYGGVTDSVIFFRRVIFGTCVTSYSNNLKITIVDENFTNTLSAEEINICEDDTSVLVNGTEEFSAGGLTYAWQTWLDSASGWQTVVGAEEKDLTLRGISDTTLVRRIVDGFCLDDTSGSIQLNFLPNISGNLIAVNDTFSTVCFGENGMPFELPGELAGGDGNFGYLWQSRETTEETWTDQVDTENFIPEELTDTTFFRRIVSTLCNIDTSNIVQIDVAPNYGDNKISVIPIVEGSNLLLRTICLGDSLDSLYGTGPEGRGSFTYLWQWTDKLSDVDTISYWEDAPGENTGLNYEPPVLSDTAYFRRIVYGSCVPDTSKLLRVNVIPELSYNQTYYEIVSDTVPVGDTTEVVFDSLTTATICWGEITPNAFGTMPRGGDGDYTFIWEVQDSLGNWSQISFDQNLELDTPAYDTLSFRRVVLSADCYQDTSNLLTLFVIPPMEEGVIGDSQQICQGATPEILSGTSPTGGDRNYAYQWQVSLDTGNVWTDIDGAIERSYQPPALFITTWYRRTASSSCFSDSADMIRIDVSPDITGHFIEEVAPICLGDTLSLLTGPDPETGVANYEYRWEYFVSDSIGWKVVRGGNNREVIASFIPDTTTTFRRIVTDACGLKDTSNLITLIVHPLPDVQVFDKTITISIGQTAQLGVSGGIEYLWTPSATLDDSISATPIASPLKTTRYSVIGKNEFGCEVENNTLVIVIDDPQLEFTNVITPNGDLMNDSFEIRGLEVFPDNKLTIFNRWGQRLGEIENYDGVTFDGLLNGTLLPEGDYFYKLEIDVSRKIFKGSFTIMR